MITRRIAVFSLGTALAISGLVPLTARLAKVFADTPTSIQLDSQSVRTRPVEDVTLAAVSKLYGRAWQDLQTALSNNDASVLGASFVGFAQDRYSSQVKMQASAGMSTKLTPLSHHAVIEFYSIDGSSLQLRDDVQLKRELLDGSKVIASETKTVPFVAVLTVVDDGWRVRILDQAQQ